MKQTQLMRDWPIGQIAFWLPDRSNRFYSEHETLAVRIVGHVGKTLRIEVEHRGKLYETLTSPNWLRKIVSPKEEAA